MRSAELIAAGATGLTLRVEFVWRGDRFGHVLSIVEQDRGVAPLLESIEAHASDLWPPSPPLQSVRIEELAGGRKAALLVGMAGRSHWSASVEPVIGQAALVFDVACRHPAGAGRLESRYRNLTKTGEPLAIEAVIGRVVDDVPEIRVAPMEISERGGTARWKYVVHPA
jgi:hypothetical protein